MDLQVKHIVSIAKLTTNVPRVAAFRVTIADNTIKHNVFNPINFQQGIRIMPFRYYENVKAPDLAPPALKQPTTTKPLNVTKPAKKIKPIVTKGKNKILKILHPKPHKATTINKMILHYNRPKNVRKNRIRHILPHPLQIPDHHMDHHSATIQDHPCKWLTLCNRNSISTSTTLLPRHLVAAPQWHR